VLATVTDDAVADARTAARVLDNFLALAADHQPVARRPGRC
jgi:hypothetical protein